MEDRSAATSESSEKHGAKRRKGTRFRNPGWVDSYDSPRDMPTSEIVSCLTRYASNMNVWRRRLLGLVPELARRGLLRGGRSPDKALRAIYRSGLSYQVVRRVIRVGERLEEFPRLRSLFERGGIGWAKCEAFLWAVTADNESMWADAAPAASKRALHELACRTTGRTPPRLHRREQDKSAANAPCLPLSPALAGSSLLVVGPKRESNSDPIGTGGFLEADAVNGTCGPSEADTANDTCGSFRSDAPNGTCGSSRSDAPNGTCGSFKTAAAADALESAGSGANRRGGVSPRRISVTVTVDTFLAERFMALTDGAPTLRAKDDGPSLNERLSYMLNHLDPSIASPARFIHVVNVTNRAPDGDVVAAGNDLGVGAPPAGGDVPGVEAPSAAGAAAAAKEQGATDKTVRTRFGEVSLDDEDLANGVCDGQVHDLSRARCEAKDAAIRYVENCRRRNRSVGRYLPAKVRRYLLLRDQGFCAVAGCRRRSTHVHHVDRFSLSSIPNPERLISCCEVHGTLAHVGALQGEQGPIEHIRVGFRPRPQSADESARFWVDDSVEAHRFRHSEQGHDPDDIFDEVEGATSFDEMQPMEVMDFMDDFFDQDDSESRADHLFAGDAPERTDATVRAARNFAGDAPERTDAAERAEHHAAGDTAKGTDDADRADDGTVVDTGRADKGVLLAKDGLLDGSYRWGLKCVKVEYITL